MSEIFALLDPVVSLAFQAVHELSQVMPAGVPVVVFTALVRLALLPLTRAALRGERARTRLSPQSRTSPAGRPDPPRRRRTGCFHGWAA